MKEIILKYIFDDNGEFLYNLKTLKIYTLSKPHKFIGKLDKKTLDIKWNKV